MSPMLLIAPAGFGIGGGLYIGAGLGPGPRIGPLNHAGLRRFYLPVHDDAPQVMGE